MFFLKKERETYCFQHGVYAGVDASIFSYGALSKCVKMGCQGFKVVIAGAQYGEDSEA